MASKDLVNGIKITPAIGPQAIITGNATTVGATVDTQGFESLVVVVKSGTRTDGTSTPQFFEGDAANMSDEAQVAAADLIGTMAAIIIVVDVLVLIHDRRTGAPQSHTLSAYTLRAFKRVPLVAVAFGMVVGGLAVHFSGFCP